VPAGPRRSCGSGHDQTAWRWVPSASSKEISADTLTRYSFRTVSISPVVRCLYVVENMVDVTGLEPATPCLQRTGVLSNRSLPYFGFQCFQQFGESAFRSKLNPKQ
jgi:hypothetical protein